MGAVKRSLFSYYGGKWRLAEWIISHFPEHKKYVEPFGGAASVLLQKPISNKEVYNDTDSELFNLFQVLRDQPKVLIKKLELTPFSRQEFELSYEKSSNSVEQARRTIVRNFMGFGPSHNPKEKKGFKAIQQSSIGKQWKNYPQQIQAITERLRGVVMENKDAFELIKKHDAPDTLFYLDPPYVFTTRYGTTNKEYTTELNDTEHKRLCKLVKTLKGFVVLSGYDNAIYNTELTTWKKVSTTTHTLSAVKRTEYLWINPCAAEHLKKSPMKKQTQTTNGLEGLQGTIVPKSKIELIAIRAAEEGNHELEQRCINALRTIKGEKVKIDRVSPYKEIPNSELTGLAEQLTESLNGNDQGKKLSADQYYMELAQSLLKHIKSGKAQKIESYIKPKGKGVITAQTQNGVTKNVYRGMMNRLILSHHVVPYFATKNNIEQKKGKLKKGAKADWVYYQRVVLKYNKQPTTWENIKQLQKSGKFDAKKYEHYALFKKYQVYNFLMIEGEFFEKKVAEFRELILQFEKDFPKPPKRIDVFLKSWPTLKIKKGMKPLAFYAPSEDYISMPPLSFFASKNRYFQALFHELGHWTGHDSRLDRPQHGKFGSEPYAKEELVAELIGYFLVNEFRMMEDLIKDKAANYLKGWSTAIREKDKAKKLVWAFKKAVEASEYVLKRDKKGVPFYIRELSKSKPSVRKKTTKTTKKSVKPKKKVAQTSLAGLGDLFTPANQRKQKAEDTFRLKGEMGKFLQELQRFRLAIVLTGDTHAGKSEFLYQLLDAFLVEGFTCGSFDLEHGGLTSKDTRASIDRNIPAKRQGNLHVAGEAPRGIDTIKEYASKLDVVAVDSWQKLDIPNKRFDELRQEYPKTIFVIIFQQNGTGGTRGGVTADFDAPIAIKVHKVDDTFKNNYAELIKNRGNGIGLKYNIAGRKLV